MNLKKEITVICIVLLPFIYLAYVWFDLPKEVPVHWNLKGEIVGYGNKTQLILIPILLPLLTYFIFLIIPKIDPKNKLNNMGNKFQVIKFFLTTFMSILALLIIYSAENSSFFNLNYLILLFGILYIILGNYFKTIKPNYFLGLRTPWTLENEIVWKETHKLAGKLYFICGFIIILSSLIINKGLNMKIFLVSTSITIIIPVIYSYIKFKNLSKTL